MNSKHAQFIHPCRPADSLSARFPWVLPRTKVTGSPVDRSRCISKDIKPNRYLWALKVHENISRSQIFCSDSRDKCASVGYGKTGKITVPILLLETGLLRRHTVPRIIPDSVIQSDTAIKRQALQSECNGSAACSGLQSTVLQRTPRRNISPGPSTLDSIVNVRFCAFAPEGGWLVEVA